MERREAVTIGLGLLGGGLAASAAVGQTATAAGGSGASMTPEERKAGVTAVNGAFPPGDVRRYGAVGDGSVDDSAAWRTATATGHRVLGGGPTQVYRFDHFVGLTRSVTIDLQGATIQPNGMTPTFVRNAPNPSVTGRFTSAVRAGSREITVANAADFEVGQWVRLSLDDYPTHDRESYPPSWNHVRQRRGTTLELESPVAVDYPAGAGQVLGYSAATLLSRFECHNGIFDGSKCTYAKDSGQAIRLGGFERVLISNCQFVAFTSDDTYTSAVEIVQCIDATVVESRFLLCVGKYQVCDIQDARRVEYLNNVVDGSHFGLESARVDAALYSGNCLRGRRMREGTGGAPAIRSVRGLKAYGCADIKIIGNDVSDYESPVKVQGCFRYDVSHNTLRNAGLDHFEGQIALNVGSQIRGFNMKAGRVIANVVEHCGGAAIGVTADPAGRVVVANNTVRDVQGSAIIVNVDNAIISGNVIEDWGLRGAGDPAVVFSRGATITGNRFAGAQQPTSPCLAGSFVRPYVYVIRDNASEADNPLFASRLRIESGGAATIASGATSVQIAHGLVLDPRPEDVSITAVAGAQGAPGLLWIDGVGNGHFTLHCAAATGGSGLSFHWSAVIRQPFTA